MDPFALDSDPEDGRSGADARTPRATVSALGHTVADSAQQPIHPQRGASSSRHSMSSSDMYDDQGERHDRVDDKEDEGPPASIVLDTHDDPAAGPSTSPAHRAAGGPLSNSRAAHTGISESVKMARMGKRRSEVGDDLENGIGGAGEYDDEDADEAVGLMGGHRAGPRSHSSSSTSHRRARDGGVGRSMGDSGLLKRMARKIQKRAERIRERDGVDESRSNGHPARRLNAKERALWKWGTLENMDDFLQQVYNYYVGKGLWCIVLTKVLNLATIAFVIGFSIFLVGCVDYSAIKHDGTLSDVVVGQCIRRFSGLTVLAFASFVGLYSWQVIRFGLDLSNLIGMRHFYTHLLNIPDADVQSISWHEVVSRIAQLRESHPTLSLSSSQTAAGPVQAGKLDAHDVANRIMRQENYLVALFNKDVLDLSMPLPGLQRSTPELTRSLEWNLTFCLLGYLFDSKGQVRRPFVTEQHRAELIEGLKRRFIFMAVINAVFAPFIVIYLLFYSFFRYFEEYHKNPSYLGARQYTQFTRWKFREFNELPHIFRRRCHNSYPYAQRYINQFPKERIAIVARFVSFIAGSFTAVLLLASVIDPDLFVHFDITPQRNVLFYIGIFGAILAVSRALVPDEEQVFEPEVLLRAVIEYTHCLPEHWNGRFHSAEVHAEFGTMYRLKISIFLSELFSVLFTPFILWRTLPHSAPAIIDFFREFTVHVDGLGYVCSFAVFDFQRHGNVNFGAPLAIRDKRLSSKEGKMEQSLLGFHAANPTWQPTDPTASLFLSRLAAEMAGTGGGISGATVSQAHPPPAPIGRMSGAALNGASGQHVHHGHTSATGIGVNFTPANSTLAQRSQLYNDAFERSILLACKPSNAAALQASASKIGPRSAPPHRYGVGSGVAAPTYRTLHAVNEDRGDEPATVVSEEDDPLSIGADGVSMYEDARLGRAQSSSAAANQDDFADSAGVNGASHEQPVNLRGLLHHIGTSKW